MKENVPAHLPDDAQILKNDGAKALKEGSYNLALSNYMSAIELCELSCSRKNESDKLLMNKEVQIIRANIAQVYLSQGKHKDCAILCNQLLIENESRAYETLDKKIIEKIKYRLCKAMGMINQSYDFISDLGKLNMKMEPDQWNLFPTCWANSKNRSECLRFDNGVSSSSQDNENLIVVLHGFGDGPASFYNLPQNWKFEKTAYLFLSGCEDLPPELSTSDHNLSSPVFSWFDYFDPKTYDWYDEDSKKSLESCSQNIQVHLDKLIRIHLVKECGWRLDQIFLFGFSQGGTMALEYLVWLNETCKKARLGGVIAISSQLLGARRKQIHETQAKEKGCEESISYHIKTPILLIHGEKDTKLLPKYNLDSVKCLKRCMDPEFIASGLTHTMFKDRGHVMLRGSNRDEMKVFYNFMANNLNGTGKKKEQLALKELVKKEGLIPL